MNNLSQANATQENTNKQEEMLKDYLKNMETCKQQAEEGKKRVENALKAKMLDEAKQHAQSTSKFAYEVLRIADLAKKVISEQNTANTANTANTNPLEELKKKINICAQNAQKLAYEADKLISDEERYKITFDKLSTLLGFLFKLGLLIGGGGVFIYCFLDINYFPSPMSIENALAFIFIALGFGIAFIAIYVVVEILWKAVKIVMVKIFKKNNLNQKSNVNASLREIAISVLIGFILTIIIGLIGFISNIDIDFIFSLLVFIWSIVLGKMILIVFLMKGWELNYRKEDKIYILGILILVIYSIICAVFAITGFNFLRFPFNQLGIALQNVSMGLSEKDFNLIKNTAEEADIPVLFSCNESEKTIHGVDVLWHGLGDNSLIEIPSREQNKNIRLELKSSENKIITLSNQTSPKGCIHARLKNSFDKGKSEPSEKMTNELNDILTKVANNYAVKKLDVTGYADLSPYKGGNQQLSKQRADVVKSKIDEIKKCIKEIGNLEVYPIGGGNYHADNKCNNPKLSEKDLEDCRMVDRGISLRFHVEQKKTNQGNQQDAQSKQQNN